VVRYRYAVRFSEGSPQIVAEECGGSGFLDSRIS
jgi:hypothetical protein